ncbi:MAG TPA: hypothetical protein VNV85_11820 [Puia sp.]|jgi:hypothetical protein|nr:hypothetical protein [Puia sp.]
MKILFVIIGIICFECSFSQAKQDRISVDTIKFDGQSVFGHKVWLAKDPLTTCWVYEYDLHTDTFKYFYHKNDGTTTLGTAKKSDIKFLGNNYLKLPDSIK